MKMAIFKFYIEKKNTYCKKVVAEKFFVSIKNNFHHVKE